MGCILVIDEQDSFREGVRNLLEIRLPSYSVIASDFELESYSDLETMPDLVIVDPFLKGELSLPVIDFFIDKGVKIVLLSMEADKENILILLKRDIQGFLMKDMSTTDLVNYTYNMLSGERYIHPFVANILLDEYQEKNEPNRSLETA
ncbi:hypothetical protein NC797_07700 [Aquibacillus sp. 3ASR75-11]|uniref:Response regulatory domain-containing protein n=1 Tax=Terrihalobacillus insolitus TaxID=2950438 RepID=A0A9X4ANC2_9BACI|nr:response regulator [Terrihalobacillus insolitus]MDC3424390.1 hypothetical protein [Terrihalobacillus insolitus]